MDLQNIIIGLVIGLILGAGVGYMISPGDSAKVSDLNNDIATLENQIAQLESQKAIIQTQLSNTQDDLEESTDALEELLTDYTSLKSEYEDYKDQVETVDVSSYEDTIADLESQIESLTGELEILQAITPPINYGAWNEIASFHGIGSQATDYFFVPEIDDVELKITWTNYGSNSDKWIHSIEIYEQGAEWRYEYMQLPELKEGSLNIHAPIPTGQTYIDVDTWIYNDAEWDIVIEAWIPD